jgi:hypothetical protein
MERQVERVVERDESLDLCAMTMMLYSLPRPADRADAIAVLPGLGETWRLAQAVQAWESSIEARHLVVASTYHAERTQVQPSIENMSQPPVNLRRQEGVRIQDHAHHTREQADWIVKEVAELDISSMALYISPYHLLRGYCTLLQAFKRSDTPWIPIIPMPVVVSPDTIIPETGVDAWTMIPGETKRILEYQKKGDVATYQEFQEYLAWLWKQPILAKPE